MGPMDFGTSPGAPLRARARLRLRLRLAFPELPGPELPVCAGLPCAHVGHTRLAECNQALGANCDRFLVGRVPLTKIDYRKKKTKQNKKSKWVP